MASQAKKTSDTDAVKTSEKLQEEAEPTARLDLLTPAGKVSNSNRLRFIARLSPLMDDLEGIADDDAADDEHGVLGMPPETMEAMADFTEYVATRFAVSDEATAELESLDFETFLQTVFTYLEQLGESIGSSN